MVVIAQLAERQNVALMVAGSSPVNHPLNREPGCLYMHSYKNIWYVLTPLIVR